MSYVRVDIGESDAAGVLEGSFNEGTSQLCDSERDKSQNSAVNVLEVMARIRSRLEEEKDQLPATRPIFRPEMPRLDGQQRKAGEIVHSEDLRFLNTFYARGPRIDPGAVRTHRNGLIGRVIVGVKRRIRAIVWDLLRDYISDEREFQGHLIRLLNDISQYTDSRDATNFWELIRKVDVDVAKCNEHLERLADDLRIRVEIFEEEVRREMGASVSRIEREHGEVRERLGVLQSVTAGLESLLVLISKKDQASDIASTPATELLTGNIPDFSYVLLENRFRGSSETIADRVARYVSLFPEAAKPILEIGPGRGELQEAFRQAGIVSYGIDCDAGMVAVAKDKGLDVTLGDGIAHLSGCAEASLGGVVAIQVVEHLQIPQRAALFAGSYRALAPGGKLIVETINPQSVLALSSNYFRDPTHVSPLHPDTLRFELELAGFRVKEVMLLSPVPEGSLLREIPVDGFTSPATARAFEVINANIRSLNALLFGYQDFAIVAEVP